MRNELRLRNRKFYVFIENRTYVKTKQNKKNNNKEQINPKREFERMLIEGRIPRGKENHTIHSLTHFRDTDHTK